MPRRPRSRPAPHSSGMSRRLRLRMSNHNSIATRGPAIATGRSQLQPAATSAMAASAARSTSSVSAIRVARRVRACERCRRRSTIASFRGGANQERNQRRDADREAGPRPREQQAEHDRFQGETPTAVLGRNRNCAPRRPLSTGRSRPRGGFRSHKENFRDSCDPGQGRRSFRPITRRPSGIGSASRSAHRHVPTDSCAVWPLTEPIGEAAGFRRRRSVRVRSGSSGRAGAASRPRCVLPTPIA